MYGLVLSVVLAFAPPTTANKAQSVAKMNRGVASAKDGKLVAALAFMREAIAANPGNVAAYYNHGHILRRSGDLTAARHAFQQGVGVARKGDAIGIEMGVQLGSVLRELSGAEGTSAADREHLLRAALKALDAAIAGDPDGVGAYRVRGETHDLLGEARAADADLRRCIALNPRDGRCWATLGRMYAEYGFMEQGIAIVELGTKFNDADATMWMGSAKVHMIAGKPKEAVDSYKRAKAIAPDAPLVWYGLGMAYAELRDRREAIDALQNFLRLAGPDVSEGTKHAANNTIARLEDVI